MPIAHEASVLHRADGVFAPTGPPVAGRATSNDRAACSPQAARHAYLACNRRGAALTQMPGSTVDQDRTPRLPSKTPALARQSVTSCGHHVGPSSQFNANFQQLMTSAWPSLVVTRGRGFESVRERFQAGVVVAELVVWSPDPGGDLSAAGTASLRLCVRCHRSAIWSAFGAPRAALYWAPSSVL
jgi:hypothetical protein